MSSFPYFNIARRFSVPYAHVLAVLAVLDRLEHPGDPAAWGWPPLQPGVCDAIYFAWHTEKTRRCAVMENSTA